jgi:hypothetical protein
MYKNTLKDTAAAHKNRPTFYIFTKIPKTWDDNENIWRYQE